MALTAPAPRHPSRPDPASWRKAIGRRLREAREDAGLRLVDVARAARVSPQYLSEVERGRKEPSSEVLQAVTAALGMTLVDLAGGVARDLARSAAPAGPVAVLHLSAVGASSSVSVPPSPMPGIAGPTERGDVVVGHGVVVLAA